MAVQLLLAIATAFLAAALGAIATGAQPPLLGGFLGASAIAAIVAVAWESRWVRSRLPFARPFVMRLHDLWSETLKLRSELTASEVWDAADRETVWRVADLESRVWGAIASETPERASTAEAAMGGRLPPDAERAKADLAQRLLTLRIGARAAHR